GLVQGERNAIAPGKRMLSSMSPTIVVDTDGKVVVVAGAGGGPRIITAVWQALSNWIDFHLAPDAAVAAPRFHHQHLPDNVRVEGRPSGRIPNNRRGKILLGAAAAGGLIVGFLLRPVFSSDSRIGELEGKVAEADKATTAARTHGTELQADLDKAVKQRDAAQ